MSHLITAAFFTLVGAVLTLFVQTLRRDAAAANAEAANVEAEFAPTLAEVREHQDAYAPVRLPLRSRVAAGLRSAWLRVAVEVAAFGEDVARLRRRVVVRDAPEQLLPPTRSWSEINEEPSRYPWPSNPAPTVSERPVRGRVALGRVESPAEFLARISERSEQVHERTAAERESLQDTGLIPRIEEPVAS